MAKRRYLGGVILCLTLIAVPVLAEPPQAVSIGTLPQPAWSDLSAQQKTILAPLAKDWETMGNVRQKKWLGIAQRYPSMKPDEQIRTQDRMREWSRLTPEERAKIRNRYKDFNQLPAEQKIVVKQKWEAYSNLPNDEKQRVRETGKSTSLLNPPPRLTESGTNETSPNLPEPATQPRPKEDIRH
ncbi:MAG: hypothetical protein CVU16_09255 [Betaproteobacteria bacterium HGW-Betaproteobacteria-10]|nr:MAG: hypothetical protein CVU16_09255 [Betaproteobacteria bacterium HGW-Betaproteobacteria-10]